jgi:hypothetical protein
MPSPLEKWVQFNLSEAYEVVHIIEVVMDERRYRIEVLKGYWNPNIPYSARAYIEEDVTIQPTYAQSSKGFEEKPRSMRIWVDYHLPWTSRDTADGALTQALGFLSDGAKKK